MDSEIVCGNCGFPVVQGENGTIEIADSPENESQALEQGWGETEFGLCCPQCVGRSQTDNDFEMPDEEGRIALFNIVKRLNQKG